ncbi:mechanosensitive ion channel family protein [Planctomycetota bacterium]
MSLFLLAEAGAEAGLNLTKILDTVAGFLSTQGLTFLINIITALIIYVIGKWVAKLLTRVSKKLMTNAGVDEMLVGFLENIVYAMLLTLVVIAAIGRLGVETTSFAAVLAAAGLAIGFALQSSLGNFAAGVMIIVFKPFKIGDLIEAGGTLGVVKEISIFTTTFLSADNKKIIVPNGAVVGGTITNFSAMETRRVDMVFGCGYGDDLLKAKKVLEEIVASDERILKDPAPAVAVAALADSSVNFNVRPWVKAEDYWAIYSHVHEQVKLRFDADGLSIPYPQTDLHVVTMPKAEAA